MTIAMQVKYGTIYLSGEEKKHEFGMGHKTYFIHRQTYLA